MKYKHIIFDFNGTLVDSSEAMNEILSGLIAKSRFKSLTPKDFEKIEKLPFAKKAKVILFFIRYQRKFLRLFGENVSMVKFAGGVKPVLARLKENNVGFSILSSNDSDTIVKFFDFHEISVESVYRSQRLLGKKKVIEKFIKQNRYAPGDVLYVGDEIRDAEACGRCGVDMVFVKWGMDANEDLTGYNVKMVAHTPEDLTEYILFA